MALKVIHMYAHIHVHPTHKQKINKNKQAA